MQQSQAFQLSKEFLSRDKQGFSIEDIALFQRLMKYHSELYYELEAPLISDSEYDELFSKLRELEAIFGVKNAFSSTVGSLFEQSSFEKVQHSRPMISLDNTYNADDLRDFDIRVRKNISSPYKKELPLQYVIEYKFDGLGIELIYEGGKLVQAVTRGDGLEGENVTANIKTIENIPKYISYRDRLEVRGEVLMPISSFEELNRELKNEGKKPFANPRNAASGSVRLKDSSVTAGRKLIFFAYDFGDMESIEKIIDLPNSHETPPSNSPLSGERANCIDASIELSYTSLIDSLKFLGFQVTDYLPVCTGIQQVINEITSFSANKKNLDFEIDGLVVKIQDISLWQEIGFTAHHPRYAIAYKFPAEIVTTILLGVEHQVGRTGTLTPVANLEPVNLGGVVVKRATLHNYEEVEKLGLHIGDAVFLKRAGEVIPKIIGLAVSCVNSHRQEKNATEILPPSHCPSCGTLIQKDRDMVRYYCPNTSSCPEQVQQKIIYAVGKQGFNIDGLGSAQVELFYRLGWIKTLPDIFSLKTKQVELLEIPGYQEKSVSKLLESIEKAKKQPLWRFLVSLSIPGVGKQAAKQLAKIFHSKEDLLIFSYSSEDLESLDDIGEKTAMTLIHFFHDQKNNEMISGLLEHIELEFPTQKLSQFSPTGEMRLQNKEGKYFGKKVCITGSFEDYSRDQLIEILESQGGDFVSSVSKKTDFLLTGEKAGSKLTKAHELGIKVLSLEEFLSL